MARLSNRNFILYFAVIAAISLTYGILNFHKAMPEVGVDFKVSRKQALQNARTYLESRKYDLTEFRQTISFSSSGGDKLYIEKELGVERLTSLSEDTLSIWRWRARFFKSLQKLEYSVYIDPKGRIVGFQREIDEAEPGLRLDTLAAQLLGEAFLSGPTGLDLEKWKLVETTTIDRPKRRDYTFTYELKDFKVKEATYRVAVELQGAEVSRYYYRLREPEDWWRDWDKQRAQNELFSNLATGAMILTLIGVFYYFFRHVKKSRIPWKTGIGLSVVLGTANFFMGVNSIPLNLAWAETTTSFGAFMIEQIVQSFMLGLLMGMTLILLYGAGEYLYRSDNPTKLSLAGLFSKRGMRSKEFFEATIMGYLLCAFFIGFVTFFYIIGSKFGFWSPADIKYDESVSTWLPWIYPLAISLYAALTEEFWFRLFGISLFKRLTKSKILAILIPAVIWAFLHSNYPQQPGYARGLEITFVGVIAGLAMMRFGIWASLVYHYVFDAVLIGLFLFRSQNLYFWTSGLIVCGFVLIPAAIAGISWLKQRKFENVDDLLNQANMDEVPEAPAPEPITPLVIPPEESPSASQFPRLTAISRKTALIIGLAGFVVLLLPSPRQFGDKFEYKIDRAEAVKQASQVLKDKFGVDPEQYKIGVKTRGKSDINLPGFKLDLPSEDGANSYLKAHASLEQAEELQLKPDGRQLYAWYVCFKKPLDATEYQVTVPMNGSQIFSYEMIADSLEGADLPSDSASQLAADFFKASVANAADYHQVEERTEKRPHRRDWFFTYETIQPVAGEAHLRQAVIIHGDEVNIGSKWIKIPEEWKRLEDKKQVGAAIFQGIGILTALLLAFWLFKSLGKAMKQGTVNWADARKFGYIAAVSVLLFTLLKTPDFWIEYDTAKPVWSAFVEWTVMTFVAIVSMFGFTMLMIALAESLTASNTGVNRPLTSHLRSIGWNRDDAVILFAMVGGVLGLKSLLSWVTFTFGLPMHTWNIDLPQSIGTYAPWLSASSSVITHTLTTGCGVVILYLLLSQMVKRPIHHLFVITAVFLLAIGPKFGSVGNWSSAEITWMAVKGAMAIVVGYYAFRAWAVGRLHAVLSTVLITELVGEGMGLAGLRGSSYQVHGWILLTIGAIIFVMLILAGINNKSSDPLVIDNS